MSSGPESAEATSSDVPNTPPGSGSGSWELILSSALSGSDDYDGSEDMYIRIGLGANFLRIQEVTPRPRRGTGSNVGQKGLEKCQFCRDKRRPVLPTSLYRLTLVHIPEPQGQMRQMQKARSCLWRQTPSSKSTTQKISKRTNKPRSRSTSPPDSTSSTQSRRHAIL